MAAFLTYVFLRGPVWLRALVWLVILLCVLFGVLQAIANLRYATQRTVPHHAQHLHAHPAHLVRR